MIFVVRDDSRTRIAGVVIDGHANVTIGRHGAASVSSAERRGGVRQNHAPLEVGARLRPHDVAEIRQFSGVGAGNEARRTNLEAISPVAVQRRLTSAKRTLHAILSPLVGED